MDVGSGPGTLIPHLQVRCMFAVFVTLANQTSRESERNQHDWKSPIVEQVPLNCYSVTCTEARRSGHSGC